MANKNNNGRQYSIASGEPINVVIRKDFPDDFVFGAATSAYQIEGGAAEGGRGLSIWDAYSLDTPENIGDGSNGNVAAQQYHMFKEDVRLMKKTGLDAYRFSISWSRLLPGGKLSTGVNKEGIKYYNALIDTILAAGMKPYATLFHWDLPLALELEYNGFRSKRIVEDFCDFAELCFWEFGDRVKHWITVNEGWTYAFRGYVNGLFPPGRGSDVPITVEKAALASIATRDLFTLIDIASIVGKDSPIRKDIEKTLMGILQEVTTLDSTQEIEDFAKRIVAIMGTMIPGFKDHFIEPLKQKLGKFIEDLLHGISVDYKTSSRHVACDQGDPGREPYVVAHNIILAHAAAVDLYRKKFQVHQGGLIGMTNNVNMCKAYHDVVEDEKAAGRALDFMFYWFVEPLVKGKYPQTMIDSVKERLPSFTEAEQKIVKGSYDFLGVNYYTTYYAINMPKDQSATPHYSLDQEVLTTPKRYGVPIGPQGGSEWLYIYPEGIYDFLIDLKKRYKVEDPVVYITENGVDEKANPNHSVSKARKDITRVNYHNDHLWNLKRAITDKEHPANVKAYFIWSFADNYEWTEGYSVRFGIFYVDYVNGRLSRYPKTSALWWMNFLSENSNNLITEGSLKKRVRDDGKEAENDRDLQKTKGRWVYDS